MKNLIKKIFWNEMLEIQLSKGIGFKPQENYFIDKKIYILGIKIKTARYYNLEDYKNNTPIEKNGRVKVKGFVINNKKNEKII